MALPEVGGEFYPTPEEVLNQTLADLRFGYDLEGITINVLPDSEHFKVAQAFSSRVSVAIANNEISSDAINPLVAKEEELDALAGVFGVFRRGASQATGSVIVGVTNGPIGIPAGFIWNSPTGNPCEVITTGPVDNNETIEIISQNSGSDQNVLQGKVGTWASAAIGQLAQSAVVAVGGIDGGSDGDNDTQLRARLLTRLGFPQVGGNVAQVAAFAEAATAAVEKAFVYAAVRGPGSYDVAVTLAGGDRELSTANLNLVAANIVANMPGHSDLNTTSVTGRKVDIIPLLELPLPVNAGGAGGGWKDAVPYPSDLETAPNVFAEITAVDLALNTITTNSTTPDAPVAGKRFAIWDNLKDNGTDDDGIANPIGGFIEFTILSVAGVTGAFIITIDTNQSGSLTFVDAALTASLAVYCSPGAERMVQYGDAIRDAVALLGPGEKTTSTDILPRGRRQPSPGLSFPFKLTAVQLAPLTDRDDDTGVPNFEEVLDISYLARIQNGTSATGTATFVELIEPDIPPTTADPPRVLVLQNLAFRAQVT